MNLYPSNDYVICRWFMETIEGLGLDLYQPNPDRAPWHVQAKIEGQRQTIVLNFWPHKLRGQIDGEMSVSGDQAIREMVARAYQLADEGEDDLIED